MDPFNFVPRFSPPVRVQQCQEGQRVASSSLEYDRTRRSSDTAAESMDSIRRMSLREANRIHCRATRERTRERERLLREEVELLTLYKAIVDSGPDLFSLHEVDPEAPFSYLCEDYYDRLGLAPRDVIGRPLASIVDPRDIYTLSNAVSQVLAQRDAKSIEASAGPNGQLVNLRVVCRGVSYEASMTITVGSEGLIVVTRLY